MMIAAVNEHFVLPPMVPTAVVFLLAGLAVAAWTGTHALSRRLGAARRRWRVLLLALRVLVGFVAILAVFQAAMRVVLLTTSWPLWPMAMAGSAAVEMLLGLYKVERQGVNRPWSVALAGLRITLPLLIVTMLSQPVVQSQRTEENRRVVVVMVDCSASMQIADAQMPLSQQVRLGEMFGAPGIVRPFHLESAADQLDRVRQVMLAQGDWLAQIAPAKLDARQQQLQNRRQQMAAMFQEQLKTIDAQAATVAEVIDGKVKIDADTRGGLTDVKAALAGQVRDNVAEGLKILDAKSTAQLGKQCSRLLDSIRAATNSLNAAVPKLMTLAEAVDKAYYDSLNSVHQAQLSAIAGRTRLELAQRVLTSRPAGKSGETLASLLEQIGRKYTLRVYQFSSQAGEVDPARWAPAEAKPSSQPAADAKIAPADQQETNIAAALSKAAADNPGRMLAGVILLTDGRHNAAASAETAAAHLVQQQVPICSILIGQKTPPRDAAVVSVQAPRTVFVKDKLLVDAQVKLDGMKDKATRVSLLTADKREICSKTITAPSDSYRTNVELTDEPAAIGLQSYTVKIDPIDGEVSTANNEYPLVVSVTDEQTKLLIVEGRPRWEFRYLKNLFADRDKMVRLQYVLFQPDKVEDEVVRPTVPASAEALPEQAQATALPKDIAEWMKFDVIILGDVDPAILDKGAQAALSKFVTERGGTLIVIGGRNFMPQAYCGTQIEPLLPVTFRPASPADSARADDVFHIALSDEGRDSVIMRLSVDPLENLRTWAAVPEINWRDADVLSAKPGATVLAYAVGPKVPDFLQHLSAATSPAGAEVLRLRKEFQRNNALISAQSVAMGQVMYLNFDRTWRLRYRIGDTNHHKFWAQVLRWATSSKLPAGTEYVKLGTDQTHYSPHTAVNVRAKIVQKDYKPVISGDVSVAVYRGDDGQLVLRRNLQYVSDSVGMYGANLGELPAGQYRIELEAPDAEPMLADGGIDKVDTGFSVDQSTPDEMIDLSADRALPSRLAGMSGGVVVDPPSAGAVMDVLGEPIERRVDRRQFVLWDSWVLLGLLAAVATAEWLIRKKAGLP